MAKLLLAVPRWLKKQLLDPVPLSEEVQRELEELLQPDADGVVPPAPAPMISGWWGISPSEEPEHSRNGNRNQVQQRHPSQNRDADVLVPDDFGY